MSKRSGARLAGTLLLALVGWLVLNQVLDATFGLSDRDEPPWWIATAAYLVGVGYLIGSPWIVALPTTVWALGLLINGLHDSYIGPSPVEAWLITAPAGLLGFGLRRRFEAQP